MASLEGDEDARPYFSEVDEAVGSSLLAVAAMTVLSVVFLAGWVQNLAPR